MSYKSLTAENLKETLWHTLQSVKSGAMDAKEANAIAAQSREIIRVKRLEINLSTIVGRSPNHSNLKFLGKEDQKK